MAKDKFYRVDMLKFDDTVHFENHKMGFSSTYLDKSELRHGDIYTEKDLKRLGIKPNSKHAKELLVRVSINEEEYVKSRSGGLIPKNFMTSKKPKLVEKGYKTNRMNCLSYFSDKGGISFKK